MTGDIREPVGLIDLGVLGIPHPGPLVLSAKPEHGLVNELVASDRETGHRAALSVLAAPTGHAGWEEQVPKISEALLAAGRDHVVVDCSRGSAVSENLVSATHYVALFTYGRSGPGWILRVTLSKPTPRGEPSPAESGEVPEGQDATDALEQFPSEAQFVYGTGGMPDCGRLLEFVDSCAVRRGISPRVPFTPIPLDVDLAAAGLVVTPAERRYGALP